MFRQLRIQNFKIWKDTGPIRMAPITLFFGANSSGKSSIGQFLMMLKQTMVQSDRKAVFYPGDKSSPVQLGSFQEMVLHRNIKNKIDFSYEWKTQDAIRIKDPASNKKYSGNRLVFAAQVGLDEDVQRIPIITHFNYFLFGKNDEQVLSIGMRQKTSSSTKYDVECEGYKLKGNPGRPWPSGPPVRFYGFPGEVLSYYKNADFVQDLIFHHEKLFASLYYLGPLRTKAERLYSWAGTEPEHVGYEGENSIPALLAARSRRINLGYKKRKKLFNEIIAQKLKDMALIEEFEVRSISKQRQEYEVKIKTKGSPDWVDLPDVGFGISQVLPVLVQLFYAPPNSIIIMEQPEIHLHPMAQAALADVMIDAVHAREHVRERNIQLIIETHSEHFLRRLQRRIAEDKITSAKVSAYFADISDPSEGLTPLDVDEYGNIKNWPDNFFGDEMGDITAQSKAALEKRLNKK